jgi:Outer membrane protein beta-barrel domain
MSMRAGVALTIAAFTLTGFASTDVEAAAKKKKPASHSSAKAKPKEEAESPEIYGGFSHTKSGSTSLNGLELEGGAPWHEHMHLLADLSLHSGSYAGVDLSQRTFLLGLDRTIRFHDLRPFGRVLLGLAHSKASTDTLETSSTGLAFGVGVGATYPITDRVGVRGLVDLLFVHGNGEWDTDPRLGIGVAYRFGH